MKKINRQKTRYKTQHTKLNTKHTNPIKNCEWSQVFRKGKQILLHMWHPSCCSCYYKPGNISYIVCYWPNTVCMGSVNSIWGNLTDYLNVVFRQVAYQNNQAFNTVCIKNLHPLVYTKTNANIKNLLALNVYYEFISFVYQQFLRLLKPLRFFLNCIDF